MEEKLTKQEESSSIERRGRLLAQAKESTQSAGVYLMKDRAETILYVGKAKILRNRLITYFQAAHHEVLRTELLVGQVHHFDVILTDSEEEALILECTLIKKHRPRYNVRLKDDKSYPYIRIRLEEDFPRLEWTRRVRKDGARYFGPFPSGGAAKSVLRLLTETFRFRDCNDNVFRHRSRPCLLYQMGKCSAPCVGLIEHAQYRADIEKAIRILEGKEEGLVQDLEKMMNEASEREDFENAAHYRDYLVSLKLVMENQKLLSADSHRNVDVIGLARKESEASVAIVLVRDARVMSVRHYALQGTDPAQPDSEVLREALAQHYLSDQDENFPVAMQALIGTLPADEKLLSKALQVHFELPASDSDRRLVSVAQANAEHALLLREKKLNTHGMESLEETQEKLNLKKLPMKIECYDISNIQGESAVASRVVFVDGAPDPSLYRRYRIKTVTGQDDFAMMSEVLARRFGHLDKDPPPDLLVVDGGKGQLARAVAILNELNLNQVEVAGIAKARTERNFRDSQVKSSFERIFLPNRKNPVPLLPHMSSYRLLTHVRDEAHRFALAYHRKVRTQVSLGMRDKNE